MASKCERDKDDQESINVFFVRCRRCVVKFQDMRTWSRESTSRRVQYSCNKLGEGVQEECIVAAGGASKVAFLW